MLEKDLTGKLHSNMDHCRTPPSNSQLDQTVRSIPGQDRC